MTVIFPSTIDPILSKNRLQYYYTNKLIHFFTYMTNTKLTQQLINRIQEVEKFNDIAELCEDFQTFVDELSDWEVSHIGGVDFFSGKRVTDPITGRSDWELNQELDMTMLDNFFNSFGCTKANPHPTSKYYNARVM